PPTSAGSGSTDGGPGPSGVSVYPTQLHTKASSGDVPPGHQDEGGGGRDGGVGEGGDHGPADAQFGGAALDERGQDLAWEPAGAGRPRVHDDVLERSRPGEADSQGEGDAAEDHGQRRPEDGPAGDTSEDGDVVPEAGAHAAEREPLRRGHV